MIAGFVEPSGGSARIGGVDVTYLPPWRRNTGMVFQSYALFPHMTRRRERRLRSRDAPAGEGRDRGAQRRRRCGSCGSSAYAERLPRQLSGGQQQRVALARALAIRPDVLLLDEPLSNLDAKLREEVRIEIRELQRQLGLTTVMVTHDQEEALTVADRLVVMADGEIRQIGSQRDLYERPADRFVAGLRRPQHLPRRPGRPRPASSRRAGGLRLTMPHDGVPGPAALALRPERLTLDADRRARQPASRPGRIRVLSRRRARAACAPVAGRPGGRADAEPRRRGRPGARRHGRGRLAARRGTGLCRASERRRNGGTDMTNRSITRRDALKAFGVAAGAAALPFCAGQARRAGRARRRRHLGRRLRPPPRQEHRGPAAQAQGL